jgi:PAS domain S-box-containing protein
LDSELGQVVNAFPGLVCTALPDGNADFVNRRWYEYSGIAPEAARGFGWQKTIHPDDLPQLIVRWMSVGAPDEGRELEARLRRVDGQYRRFSFRRAPIADAAGRIVKWCGIFTDVENQRQAEDSLRESRDRLRLIFEGLPALAIVTSSSGDLIHANGYCLDYLGATFEELKGWERGHSYHPDDRPSVLAAWRHSLETGAPYVIEGRRRRADGAYRWFHTRGFPLRDGEGNIDLWYLLATDFDDLKRADEAVSASERKLKLIINTIPATA